MSNERDELAAVLEKAYDLNPGMASFELLAQATLNAGYRKPRMVTTVEELDALPVESVIRSDMGNVFEKDCDLDKPSDTWWTSVGSATEFHTSRILLPAVVLHEGETNV